MGNHSMDTIQPSSSFELGNLEGQEITMIESASVRVDIHDLEGNLVELSNRIPNGVIKRVQMIKDKEMIIISTRQEPDSLTQDSLLVEYAIPVFVFKIAMEGGFIKISEASSNADENRINYKIGDTIEFSNIRAMFSSNARAVSYSGSITGIIKNIANDVLQVLGDRGRLYTIQMEDVYNYNSQKTFTQSNGKSSHISPPTLPTSIGSLNNTSQQSLEKLPLKFEPGSIIMIQNVNARKSSLNNIEPIEVHDVDITGTIESERETYIAVSDLKGTMYFINKDELNVVNTEIGPKPESKTKLIDNLINTEELKEAKFVTITDVECTRADVGPGLAFGKPQPFKGNVSGTIIEVNDSTIIVEDYANSWFVIQRGQLNKQNTVITIEAAKNEKQPIAKPAIEVSEKYKGEYVDEDLFVAKMNSQYRLLRPEEKDKAFKASRKHTEKINDNDETVFEDWQPLKHPDSVVAKYFMNFGINVNLMLQPEDRATLITYLQQLLFNCNPKDRIFNSLAFTEIARQISSAVKYKNIAESERLHRVNKVLSQLVEKVIAIEG